MIPFNSPLLIGTEMDHIKKVIESNHFSSGGYFTKKCEDLLASLTQTNRAFLTTSCTDALEMAALCLDIEPENEVILPSFTFVSSANPFVLRNAKIKFVDIDPLTMNIDPNHLKKAITKKTKAICIVHYAGVSCNMDAIITIAKEYNIPIIEDAAQGLMSYHNQSPLGSIGNIGCISFHDTKNFHCGEGGVILINDENYIETAEKIKEKGTNRKQFLRGQIDKYSWVSIGSSFCPSELNAAFLYGQLESAEIVHKQRIHLWNLYYSLLTPLKKLSLIELPYIPNYASHNAHIFYIKAKNLKTRNSLISYLKHHNIQTTFHYVPLHDSEFGKRDHVFKRKRLPI